MTQEEKAKAYDEALERAKKAIKYPDKPCFARVDEIFPELRESEDERIRNWLIGYFHQYKEDGMEKYANGLKVESIIDWLEKQGEQSQGNSAAEANNEVLHNIPVIVDADKAFYDMICEYFDDGRAMSQEDTDEFKKWLLTKLKKQ